MSIRERISPAVPFTLDVEDATGKFSLSFRLAYNFRSLGLIERHTGKSMLTQATEVFENPTCDNVSILLWAALQENHPEYREGRDEKDGGKGLAVVQQNLTLGQAKAAKDACEKAFVKQLPDAQVDKLLNKGSAAPLEQSPATQEASA